MVHKEKIYIKQIEIDVIEGKALPIKDKGGLSDPYVKVFINAKKYKTPRIDQNLNPVWNETIIHKRHGELKETDIIRFEVWDWDSKLKCKGHDFIGENTLKLSDIYHKNGYDGWIKLYDRQNDGGKQVYSDAANPEDNIIDHNHSGQGDESLIRIKISLDDGSNAELNENDSQRSVIEIKSREIAVYVIAGRNFQVKDDSKP